MAPAGPEVRDLGAGAADLEVLLAFYENLYAAAFPDPDERESLANMKRYLRLKATGWYGTNNYHVRVLMDGGRIAAGSVSDYLAGPNTGVIEFLVVAPDARRRGLGRRMLDDLEAALGADARAAGSKDLRAVVAEMNDPFRGALRSDSMDPFARLRIWSDWGFQKLDFPYVQPALSAEQRPVTSMLLAWKPVAPAGSAVPAATVKQVVHEYLRWAMRIEHPERSAEFGAMARHLDQRDEVALMPLDGYVGHDAALPFVVHEITAADDADLPALRALYRACFPDRATAVEDSALGGGPASVSRRGADHAYHLWALRPSADGPVSGLVSFFTLPDVGFGGYVALGPLLRGTGRLPLVLARVEAQMVRDDLGATGWYVECGDDAAPSFGRAGFHELAVTYRQPPLRPGGPAPVLRLLYKSFGRAYEAPMLGREGFLGAIRQIYRVVYSIDRAEGNELYRELARQVTGPVVPLR
jgi:ribosomal protein S18 acetylase RimI-like enzyme